MFASIRIFACTNQLRRGMGDAGEGEGVLFRDRVAVCMHCDLKWVHALSKCEYQYVLIRIGQ